MCFVHGVGGVVYVIAVVAGGAAGGWDGDAGEGEAERVGDVEAEDE